MANILLWANNEAHRTPKGTTQMRFGAIKRRHKTPFAPVDTNTREKNADDLLSVKDVSYIKGLVVYSMLQHTWIWRRNRVCIMPPTRKSRNDDVLWANRKQVVWQSCARIFWHRRQAIDCLGFWVRGRLSSQLFVFHVATWRSKTRNVHPTHSNPVGILF